MVVRLSPNFILPDILPISDLRQRQNAVLEQLHKKPVVLTQRGRAAAVMVDPAQWNALMEELEDLRDSICGIEALEEYRQNPEDTVTLEKLESDLKSKGIL